MTRYVNLIQMHVRHKIELISILRINYCVRSAFAYCEPSLIVMVRKLWFPLTIHGIYMGILILYFPEEL